MLRTENIEHAVQRNRDELFRFGTALIFIVGIMLFTIVRTDGGTDGILLVAAAMKDRPQNGVGVLDLYVMACPPRETPHS